MKEIKVETSFYLIGIIEYSLQIKIKTETKTTIDFSEMSTDDCQLQTKEE